MYITTEQLRKKIEEVRKVDAENGNTITEEVLNSFYEKVDEKRPLVLTYMGDDGNGDLRLRTLNFVPVAEDVWTNDRVALDVASKHVTGGVLPIGEDLPTWLGQEFFNKKYKEYKISFEAFLATLQ